MKSMWLCAFEKEQKEQEAASRAAAQIEASFVPPRICTAGLPYLKVEIQLLPSRCCGGYAL